MRICILSDAVFPTPTPNGHGLGRVVSLVAEGLHARGHDVTLVGKQGSTFSGGLITADVTGYPGEAKLAALAYQRHKAHPFDVFLDNSHTHHLSDLFPRLPVVNVYHDVYQPFQRCAVLLSYGQQALMPQPFERARVIHNALPAEDFEINNETDDYLLFVGALSEIKQPLLAIEAAARYGKPLVMAGKPLIGRVPFAESDNVRYVGEISGPQKARYFSHARVFLQLGTVESFGLTTLEAGLSGTPVVAWPAGGSLDLIRYGKNGVFVPAQGKDKVQNVCDAIERAWHMDRKVVRQTTEQLSDVDKQIDAYEDVMTQCVIGEWW